MQITVSDELERELRCWATRRRYVDRVTQLRGEGRTYQTPRGTMLRAPTPEERAEMVAMAGDVLHCRRKPQSVGADEGGTEPDEDLSYQDGRQSPLGNRFDAVLDVIGMGTDPEQNIAFLDDYPENYRGWIGKLVVAIYKFRRHKYDPVTPEDAHVVEANELARHEMRQKVVDSLMRKTASLDTVESTPEQQDAARRMIRLLVAAFHNAGQTFLHMFERDHYADFFGKVLSVGALDVD